MSAQQQQRVARAASVVREHVQERSQGREKEQREREKLRQSYRKLLAATSEKREEFSDPSSCALHEALETAEVLFTQVKAPREAALDSELLSHVSAFNTEHVLRLQTTARGFDVAGFVAKVRSRLSPAPPPAAAAAQATTAVATAAPGLQAWARLGREVQGMWQTTPALDVLLGPIIADNQAAAKAAAAAAEAEEQQQQQQQKKPRQTRPRAQREKGENERPEDVTRMSESEATETAARISGVRSRLAALPGSSCELWRFVVDPQSFGQTVENLFYVSFLVKDGLAALSLAEDGTITISELLTHLPHLPPPWPRFFTSTLQSLQRRHRRQSWKAGLHEASSA